MRLSYDDLKKEFLRVLLACHAKEALAEECAKLFADTTQSGVYSHGVNRFPRFIQQLRAGHVLPEAVPERMLSLAQVGITLTSILTGLCTGAFLAPLLTRLLDFIP